jgi:hypothetical protein
MGSPSRSSGTGSVARFGALTPIRLTAQQWPDRAESGRVLAMLLALPRILNAADEFSSIE